MEDRDFLVLVVLLALIGLAILMNVFFKDKEEPKVKEECKRHNWSTNPRTNQLQCVACSYIAGTHATDQGDY